MLSAYAQTAAAGGSTMDSLFGYLPIVAMFAVLYFLMIRPQAKRQKEQRSMIDALKKGDEVITSGGVLGRIAKIAESYLVLEVAETKDGPVELAVQRQAVQTVLPKGTIKGI